MVSNAGRKRGQEYAVNETAPPHRMVFHIVPISYAIHLFLPVHTSAPFPKKAHIPELLAEIRQVNLNALVKTGKVILANVLDAHIDVVTSCDLN